MEIELKLFNKNLDIKEVVDLEIIKKALKENIDIRKLCQFNLIFINGKKVGTNRSWIELKLSTNDEIKKLINIPEIYFENGYFKLDKNMKLQAKKCYFEAIDNLYYFVYDFELNDIIRQLEGLYINNKTDLEKVENLIDFIDTKRNELAHELHHINETIYKHYILGDDLTRYISDFNKAIDNVETEILYLLDILEKKI